MRRANRKIPDDRKPGRVREGGLFRWNLINLLKVNQKRGVSLARRRRNFFVRGPNFSNPIWNAKLFRYREQRRPDFISSWDVEADVRNSGCKILPTWTIIGDVTSYLFGGGVGVEFTGRF